MLIALCLVFGARAQGAPSASISQSRRFVVWAPSREQGTLWATWADSSARDLADMIGPSPSQFDSAPIYIHIIPDADDHAESITAMQSYPDGRLQQRLLINRRRHSGAEAMAGLVGLLCNRHAIARQSVVQRSRRPTAMPEWLSTGLALNMPGSNRAHYRALAAGIWRRGEMPSVADCLQIDTDKQLPSPRREAVLYAFLRWLLNHKDFEAIFDRAVATSIEQRRLSPLDLLDRITTIKDAAALEKSWEMSLAHIAKIEEIVDRSDPLETLSRIDTLIDQLPRQYSLLAGSPVDFAQLANYREAEWMPDLCARATAALQDLALNANDDIRQVIEMYIDVFEVLRRPAHGFFKKMLGKSVGNAKIQRKIAAAHASKLDLKELYRRYNSYLDGVEENLYNQRGAWQYSPSVEELEYINRFEEKHIRQDQF